ncbi:MAG: plasmid stabilization system protein [Flavobacteriaceae bacterium]|nr:MAG: plasmid stabilization system protein [Flavobacteriaceae bacterium]
MVRKLRWDKEAVLELQEIFNFIKKQSPTAANKVKTSIRETTKELAEHSEIYSLDRYKNNNSGTIRAFEKHNIRITYKVTPTTILIIRLRHTSREPLSH